MPRVKLFNEVEALEKAINLFWEKGYADTSLTDLTERLGISKGSFYATFTSKRALFDNAFSVYRKSNINFLETMLNSESDVKTGIRKLFEFNLEQAFNDKNRKGCFVANTCSEMGGADEGIRNHLKSHHKAVHTILSKYLQKESEVKGFDSNQVSDVYITFLTGINQEVKFKEDKKRIAKSVDLMVSLIE